MAEPSATRDADWPDHPVLARAARRLLDRGAARLPEELDLAEAVCAIKWPKWPEYRGPIDLGLLRRRWTAPSSTGRRSPGSGEGDRAGAPGGRQSTGAGAVSGGRGWRL